MPGQSVAGSSLSGIPLSLTSVLVGVTVTTEVTVPGADWFVLLCPHPAVRTPTATAAVSLMTVVDMAVSLRSGRTVRSADGLLGAKTIDWLYNIQLQVDDEWSVRTPTGFTWWADQNAQTIEVVGQDTGPDGQLRLHHRRAHRDAGRSRPHRRGPRGAQRGPDALRGDGRPGLRRGDPHAEPALPLRTEIASWMRILISTAAVLQIAEARLLGPVFAEQFGARPAHSGHPQNGPRPEPDDMAFTAGVFLDQGKQPCMWPAEEFEESVKQYMLQPPHGLGHQRRAGPGGGVPVRRPDLAVPVSSGENPHPIYGNGLLIVQRFPLSADTPAKGVRMALDLNGSDLTRQVAGYGFGSYAYVDDMLCFTGFLPNPLRSPGLLPSIYFSCATRAHSMAIRPLNRPWT